jgi:hypothetical protein
MIMEMKLQTIKFKDLEIWENSPRIPISIQEELQGLNAEEKLAKAIPYFVFHQAIVPLAGALSVLGWSPIEHLWTIQHNGKLVAFDGNRRIVACYLLLHPEHPLCPTEIKLYAKDMKPEIRKSLMSITVMEFNSNIYSLEAVYEKSLPFNKSLNKH